MMLINSEVNFAEDKKGPGEWAGPEGKTQNVIFALYSVFFVFRSFFNKVKK